MERSVLWYWIALKLVPRLSVPKKLALVEQFTIEGIFKLSDAQLIAFGISALQRFAILNPDIEKINSIIASANNCCNYVTYQDSAYPELLKQIYDPPLILCYQGHLPLLSKPQVAIVGSRHASAQGREFASKLAYDLVQAGIVVTSGMALGVDGAAHKGALANSGSTIAVVATGLDRVYPARHRSLSSAILEQEGLIISEFFPGMPPKPGNFPKRNRLISGLSKGVVIVEAAMKSGSLITARCALEQNREVFAVPGSIQNPNAKGCHYLIQEGAKLIESAADIIKELNITPAEKPQMVSQLVTEKNCQQDLFLDPLLASVDYEVTPVDKVISRSKLPTDEVLTRLTMLELRGLVSAVPGGYLRLNRG